MTFFGIASFVITVCAYPPYIKAMIEGTTKPQRSSWFIWFALDLVGFLSLLSIGTFNWLLLAFTIGTALIAIFSLKYGASGWNHIDTLSALAAIVSIAAWIIVGPAASLVCMLAGATIGSLPTIISVCKGYNEDLTAWLIVMASTTCSLLDGNIFVSVWYLVLQSTIVGPVLYYKFVRTTSPVPR